MRAGMYTNLEKASISDLIGYLKGQSVYLDVAIGIIEKEVSKHREHIDKLTQPELSLLENLEQILLPIIHEMRLADNAYRLTNTQAKTDQLNDHFSALPNEIIFCIMSKLPIYDLVSIFQVSKKFSSIALDEKLEVKMSHLYCKNTHLIFNMPDKAIKLKMLSRIHNSILKHEDRLIGELDEIINSYPRIPGFNYKHFNANSGTSLLLFGCALIMVLTLIVMGAGLWIMYGKDSTEERSIYARDWLISCGAVFVVSALSVGVVTAVKRNKINKKNAENSNNRDPLCVVKEEVSRFFSQKRLVKPVDELHTQRKQGPALQSVVVMQ